MATKTAAKKYDGPQVDMYQEITDLMVGLLESGTAPWTKPWTSTVGGGPRSMSTKKSYQGINELILGATAMAKGYESPWWGTFKSIQALGGKVRKGEKGTRIAFWKRLPVRDEETGETKVIPLLKHFTVFNLAQADGVEGLPEITTPEPVDAIEACEKAVAGYLATGPRLRHVAGEGAYWQPSTDVITLPTREEFHSSAEYYGALFHECAHSTGHASRLDRKDVKDYGQHGCQARGREELTAEMSASFLAAATGIIGETADNSAAYLRSWVAVLKGDKKAVVYAAGRAQKAVALITGEMAQGEAEEA